uniref:UPF0518 protein GK23746 n=1 Tax=Cacopsylla melanoneura TaxID=428564 RepID=A0A8D8YKT3_9HEMI
MSWLRNGTLSSNSYNPGPRSSLACKEYHDPIACYESFKKHWQQVMEVFLKFKDGSGDIKQEDVVIIVNHLDQIISLLINFADKQCLEYLLKEKILDQLCHLSLNCDKNGSDLRVKQLRIYKVLVSKFQTCILNNESFLSPLTKLLISCHENVFSLDVEKILVSLLHQLCITLFQQNELLEFFFPSEHEKQNNTSERFVILSLLVSYIHREEELGRQARDALLLCLALSKDNIHVAQFIIQDSDLCPVLATGLSGLYSSLPRKLDIDSEEWHRFSHEDVNNIPELSAFMLSLDFCNVVIQKSHRSVQIELLELLYKGFLEPVLGPALMQVREHGLTFQ